MKKLLAIIKETFYISGRGLVISPFFPEDKFSFQTKEEVLIETPEGKQVYCQAHFQIPMIIPKPKKYEYHCMLLDIEKVDVPIGSKLWLIYNGPI